MAAPARKFYMQAEYLAFEDAAAYKSEYHNGQIVMMAGASDAHNLIPNPVGYCTIKLGIEPMLA